MIISKFNDLKIDIGQAVFYCGENIIFKNFVGRNKVQS